MWSWRFADVDFDFLQSQPLDKTLCAQDRFHARRTRPLQSKDDVLLVASFEDLIATKLKATMDRAEAKDDRDIDR